MGKDPSLWRVAEVRGDTHVSSVSIQRGGTPRHRFLAVKPGTSLNKGRSSVCQTDLFCDPKPKRG